MLSARANPLTAGIGFLLEAPWPHDTNPPPASRVPLVNDVLQLLADPDTSSTLRSALRGWHCFIGPDLETLTIGERSQVEVVCLLPSYEDAPPSASLRLTLEPAGGHDSFPSVSLERGFSLKEFAAGASCVRVGIEIELGEELPPGPASVQAEIRWPGTRLLTPRHSVALKTEGLAPSP